MRKILLSLLVSMATCSMTWAAVGDEATVNGVTYTVMNVRTSGTSPYTNEDMAVVTSIGEGVTEVTLPKTLTIEGAEYKVTIDFKSSPSVPFAGNTVLTKVDLSNMTWGYKTSGVGVSNTQLPAGLFKDCTGLVTVVLPEGMQRLSDAVFYNCSSLKNVNLEETGVESVLNGAGSAGVFYGCSSLETLTFPSGFGGTLNDNMFNGCSSLKSTNIGDCAITDINSYAFKGCTSLESLSIPTTVKSIGTQAFANSGLKSFDMSAHYSQLTSFNNTALQGCTKLESVNFKGITNANINSVPNFQNCTALNKVVLSSYMTSIPKNGFNNTGLTTVGKPGSGADLELGSNMTSLGDNVFQNCPSLKSVDLSGITSASVKLISAFNNCTALTDVVLPVNMPMTISSSTVFTGCSEITTVTMPVVVDVIPNGFCDGLSKLTTVNVAKPLTAIGDNAFRNCKALVDFAFPETLKSIGGSAFSNTGLTEAILPNSVESLGSNAFDECANLSDFRIPENDKLTALPQKLIANTAVSSIKIPGNIAKISNTTSLSPFYNCVNLTEVDMSESSITSIGRLFTMKSGNSKVSKLLLPEGLKTIEKMACYNMDQITEITFPETLETIDVQAFQGTKLTSIVIPQSVTAIKNKAFQNVPFEKLYINAAQNIDMDAGTATDKHKLTISRMAFNSSAPAGFEVWCAYLTPPTMLDDTFSTSQYKGKLQVYPGVEDAYRNATGWSNFSGIMTGVENIGEEVVGDEVLYVYNTQGVLVMKTTDRTLPGLEKGIYIVNGKKILK